MAVNCGPLITDDDTNTTYIPITIEDAVADINRTRVGYDYSGPVSGMGNLMLTPVNGDIEVVETVAGVSGRVVHTYRHVHAVGIWSEGPCVGYTLANGQVLYFNPSTGSTDNTPNVFVYLGDGDPSVDTPLHFFDLTPDDAASPDEGRFSTPTLTTTSIEQDDAEPRFTEPLHPDAMADLDGDEDVPPYSPLVAESLVMAHQSRNGNDVLNIEVDAPAGVTVRLNINDGHVGDFLVPE